MHAAAQDDGLATQCAGPICLGPALSYLFALALPLVSHPPYHAAAQDDGAATTQCAEATAALPFPLIVKSPLGE